MTDTEIVDAINHKLSLLAVNLATLGDHGDDLIDQRNLLSLFAVECNRLVAQRIVP